MDEVRLWDVARTQAQIQSTMFSEIPANTPGLVAYYRFNQGTVGADNTGPTTLTDAATPAHNGLLRNFALSGATSNWVAGYPSLLVLPLRLIAFTGEGGESGITLRWKTPAQQTVSAFEVERSSDGRSFLKIAFITALRNNLQGTQLYF